MRVEILAVVWSTALIFSRRIWRAFIKLEPSQFFHGPSILLSFVASKESSNESLSEFVGRSSSLSLSHSYSYALKEDQCPSTRLAPGLSRFDQVTVEVVQKRLPNILSSRSETAFSTNSGIVPLLSAAETISFVPTFIQKDVKDYFSLQTQRIYVATKSWVFAFRYKLKELDWRLFSLLLNEGGNDLLNMPFVEWRQTSDGKRTEQFWMSSNLLKVIQLIVAYWQFLMSFNLLQFINRCCSVKSIKRNRQWFAQYLRGLLLCCLSL